MSSAVLEARSLTKSYGRHRGIVDVDMIATAGEVVGLVGANGAGKTTFMRTLLDFIRPTSGSLDVFGLDSVRDSVAVRRRTSYLPGEILLPSRMTGADVVRRFCFARDARVTGRAHLLADRLDLDLTRRVGDLSKGNRQKVGLVLAFAPQVDLLVLDEPTSGLDPLLQREVGTMIAEVTHAGATVLLSSHVISEVEQLADRVALMREGRVAAFDHVDVIRTKARRRGLARPASEADAVPLSDALRSTLGVTDVHVERGGVAFASSGTVDPLLATLAGFSMASLDLTQANLEDAFFSAYDDGPAAGI